MDAPAPVVRVKFTAGRCHFLLIYRLWCWTRHKHTPTLLSAAFFMKSRQMSSSSSSWGAAGVTIFLAARSFCHAMRVRKLRFCQRKSPACSSVHLLKVKDLRATKRHLPYGITKCYLTPDIGEQPHLNSIARHSSTRLTYPRGMGGWVDIGIGDVPKWFTCPDLIATRPGVEPTTSWL